MSKELPKRFPLAVPQNNRSISTLKDGRLVNCYAESSPDGGYSVNKRPGLFEYGAVFTAAGTAKGIYNWQGSIYAVVDGTFYKNGVAIGAVDNTAGKLYFFNSNLAATPTLIFSNGVISYAYNSGIGLVTVASLGGAQPPANFVPGWCFINGTMYYMNANAYILGSGINDYATWDPLNSIRAQIEPDPGVALSKHLVYAVAFKQWTTEIFENIGTTPSPLAPNFGAKINYGCANAYSVKDVDGNLYWITQTQTGQLQVGSLTHLNFEIISTPAIDKLLSTHNILNTVWSWCYKGEGHTFYILTFPTANLTLAYDINERLWCQWTDVNGNYLPIVSSTFVLTNVSQLFTVAQHATNGHSYFVSGLYTNDVGAIITSDIYTPNFDANVDRRKTLNRIRFNGDQTPGSLLKVRSNDYDYATDKWTNFRNVNMNSQRPILTNCGTFYRRAYHIRHACDTLFRITSLDADLDIGSL